LLTSHTGDVQYPAERCAFSANRIGTEDEDKVKVEKQVNLLSGATKIALEESSEKDKDILYKKRFKKNTSCRSASIWSASCSLYK
jgi:hypothetical protein